MKKGTIVFSLVCTLIMILKSECDKCEIFWVNQNPNIFAYQKLHGGKMVRMNVQIYIYQNSYLNAHLNILITNLIFKWIFWIMIYSNEYSFDWSTFLDICSNEKSKWPPGCQFWCSSPTEHLWAEVKIWPEEIFEYILIGKIIRMNVKYIRGGRIIQRNIRIFIWNEWYIV